MSKPTSAKPSEAYMARKRNAAKVNAVTTGEAPWGNIETNVLSKPPENVRHLSCAPEASPAR